jgi:hypothetical protein
MYISLADSRATGFLKWADAHQREGLDDAGVPKDDAIAALDLERGATVPAEPPRRS